MNIVKMGNDINTSTGSFKRSCEKLCYFKDTPAVLKLMKWLLK